MNKGSIIIVRLDNVVYCVIFIQRRSLPHVDDDDVNHDNDDVDDNQDARFMEIEMPAA